MTHKVIRTSSSTVQYRGRVAAGACESSTSQYSSLREGAGAGDPDDDESDDETPDNEDPDDTRQRIIRRVNIQYSNLAASDTVQ